jgi:hypothetical protein
MKLQNLHTPSYILVRSIIFSIKFAALRAAFSSWGGVAVTVTVKVLLTFCRSTRHNIREDLKVYQHRCDNFKSRNP